MYNTSKKLHMNQLEWARTTQSWAMAIHVYRHQLQRLGHSYIELLATRHQRRNGHTCRQAASWLGWTKIDTMQCHRATYICMGDFGFLTSLPGPLGETRAWNHACSCTMHGRCVDLSPLIMLCLFRDMEWGDEAYISKIVTTSQP